MKAWFSFELKGLLSLRCYLLLMKLLRKKATLQKQRNKKKQTRKEHDISRRDKIFISWRDKCILKLNTFIMWTLHVTADPSEKILTTANMKHYFLEKIMQPVKAAFVICFTWLRLLTLQEIDLTLQKIKLKKIKVAFKTSKPDHILLCI